MTSISIDLREDLKKVFLLKRPEINKEQCSIDGTRKWLIKLDDGNLVETVYIPEDNRGTLCVSSQVGCTLNCKFCHTGTQKLVRNLTTEEIVSQLMIARDQLKDWPANENRKISNIVFMGMGEPLLNESPVYDACDILLDDWAFGLSRRRVTVSSSGIVPALKRMSDTVPVSLAISLHAPNDELRDILVPINKKYPIKELMKACHYYLNAGTQERHVMFEYVMLKGVNDSIEQAQELSKLINFWFQGESAKVNLIPFNPFPETKYTTSNDIAIDKFQDILYRSGIRTTTRRTRGDDVDAACGQLAGKVVDKSRRIAGRD
mgnify:CR=1 FL=1